MKKIKTKQLPKKKEQSEDIGILEFLKEVSKGSLKADKKRNFTKTLKVSFGRVWRKLTADKDDHLQ